MTTAAQVPLALVFLDYARREVGFRRFLQLSGDPAADMAAIAQGFGAFQGRRPQLAAPIREARRVSYMNIVAAGMAVFAAALALWASL